METVALKGKIETKKYVLQGMPFLLFGVVMFMLIYSIHFNSNVATIGMKIIVGAFIYLTLSLVYIYKFHKEILNSIIPIKKAVK